MLLIIIILLVVGVVLLWVSCYNSLVKNRNWVRESYSQIDVQLQRRNDLIPNLVNTVKGYMNHEGQTLQAVTQARQQLVDLPKDTDPNLVNEYSNNLSNALGRLLAVSESYPDLKSNQNFLDLQSSLDKLEKEIAISRQIYNSSVTQYNNKLETIPSNLVAKVHGFTPFELLSAPEEARNVPEVSFD